MQCLYTENHKPLMREIKENLNKQEKAMLIDWKLNTNVLRLPNLSINYTVLIRNPSRILSRR